MKNYSDYELLELSRTPEMRNLIQQGNPNPIAGRALNDGTSTEIIRDSMYAGELKRVIEDSQHIHGLKI